VAIHLHGPVSGTDRAWNGCAV